MLSCLSFSAEAAFTTTHSSSSPSQRHNVVSSSSFALFGTATPTNPPLDSSSKESQSKSQSQSQSQQSLQRPSQQHVEFTDFWGTRLRQDDDRADDAALPCVPTLEKNNGPLPRGAYVLQGNSEFDPKRTCRVALAIDVPSDLQDLNLVVQQVQQCIDAGFQTFQLQNQNSNQLDLVARIRQATPSYYAETHFALAFKVPKQSQHQPAQAGVSVTAIRQQVLDLIEQTQGDAIDTLLVQYENDKDDANSNTNENDHHSYYLEVLDALTDLQRDGWIRSIGVEEWPRPLIQKARDCGFVLNVLQQPGNLLVAPTTVKVKHNHNKKQNNNNNNLNIWWTNPLAGDFLSLASSSSSVSELLQRRVPPTHWKDWKEVVQRWGRLKRRSDDPMQLWKSFQQDVLQPLQELCWKHEVSLSTICLRWALQCNEHDSSSSKGGVTGVILPVRLGTEESQFTLHQRIQEWRNVFRFALDEEDIEILQSIVARPKGPKKFVKLDDVDVRVPIEDIPLELLEELQLLNTNNYNYNQHEEEGEDEEEEEGEDYYPEIDFKNAKLWL